jgi:hypothetical protein
MVVANDSAPQGVGSSNLSPTANQLEARGLDSSVLGYHFERGWVRAKAPRM